MNFKKIEEAIEEKMAETESYEGIKQSVCYFAIERLLKEYAWKCWREGVKSYNENQL